MRTARRDARRVTLRAADGRLTGYLDSAFQTAWNAHDAVAVSALFTPDADQLMGDGPVTQGKNAVQQWWRDRFAAMPKGTSIVLTVRSVRVITPDVALLNVLAKVTGQL